MAPSLSHYSTYVSMAATISDVADKTFDYVIVGEFERLVMHLSADQGYRRRSTSSTCILARKIFTLHRRRASSWPPS